MYGKIPYKTFTGRANPPSPKLSFGHHIVFLQGAVMRGRLDPSRHRGRYLGSALSKIAQSVPRTHRVWDPVAGRVVIVAQVKPFGNPTRVSPLPLLGLEW